MKQWYKVRQRSLVLFVVLVGSSLLLNSLVLLLTVVRHPPQVTDPPFTKPYLKNVEASTPLKVPFSQTTTAATNIDHFSACMLIKDDNDILEEWLAYHMYVLNLRYLVVAVDPSSQTSPAHILQKWSNLTDLKVLIWGDTDFMPRHFLEKGYHIAPQYINPDANASKWHEGYEDPEQVIADTMRINNHRFRQQTFLASCYRHLRRKNKRFVIHLDTDEYITANPKLRRQLIRRLNIPPVSKESSVLALLNQSLQIPDLRSKMNYPCISLPRLLYGSVELANDTQTSVPIPMGFNATAFETFRWKYHTAYDDVDRNAQPKVIIDLSQVPLKDELFRAKVFSIHRPSKALCRRIAQINMNEYYKFPLTVNHYVGSWERYSARNDTRRSARAYEFKAHVTSGRDVWIASWLDGFVEKHGPEKSRLLLERYYKRQVR